jgi:tetratricopeptide (TPR) repeat protein
MKRKTYTSEAIDIQLEHAQYAYGVRDYTKHESIIDSVRWDIKDFMNWVSSDDPRNKYKRVIQKSGGDPELYPKGTQEMVFYPTNKIRVNVNVENVIQSGLVKEKDRDLIVPYIDIDLPKGGLYKNQLIMLDILANNDWKRPLYFTGGSYDDSEYIWMKNYLQLEGLVYKLVPIKTPKNKNNPYLMGRLDGDLMYEIAKKWEWGNSDSPEIYHDPETRKNSISYRSNMARLAEVLIDEGKLEKAKEIIDLNLEKMPVDYFGYYSLLTPFIEGYYRVGATEDARKLFDQIAEKYRDQLEYFESLSLNLQYDLGEEILTEVERYRALTEVIIDNNDGAFMASKIVAFQNHTAPFEFLYGSYDYFTSQEDFVAGLYIGGDSIAGRSLIESIASVYEKRLSQLSGLDPEDQTAYEEIIMDEVNGYRRLMLYVSLHETDAYRDNMEKRIFIAIEPLAMFDSMFGEE